MGVPALLAAGRRGLDFRTSRRPRSDPLTGQSVVDPETGEPAVEHQYLATSRNNFLFLGGVPVFYWPVMATDLEKPNYYFDGLRVKHDNVFGFQVLTDRDMYQLLGIRDPPEGTEVVALHRTTSASAVSRWAPTSATTASASWPFPARCGACSTPGAFTTAGSTTWAATAATCRPTTEPRPRAVAASPLPARPASSSPAEVGWISDRNFLEQYYEQEWDEHKDQITGVELKRYLGTAVWSLTADVRLNEFFTQTEWLPRLDHFLLGQSCSSVHLVRAFARRLRAAETATLPPPPARAGAGVAAVGDWTLGAGTTSGRAWSPPRGRNSICRCRSARSRWRRTCWARRPTGSRIVDAAE